MLSGAGEPIPDRQVGIHSQDSHWWGWRGATRGLTWGAGEGGGPERSAGWPGLALGPAGSAWTDTRPASVLCVDPRTAQSQGCIALTRKTHE